ncbi:diaminopimelate epimerase [Kosmotoga sp. DU53]|uniref:diaminopimelate epimerase n=1 Tax=Kosmotoga sp. DU53 TaxID=1310160 RepID=UPI0007C5155D|nr:diaminopimelate epimerase [Kosmotoga sp. DU53]OAA21965.1 diaminopimelate epimerase [Kosmotoga sp. DU53]
MTGAYYSATGNTFFVVDSRNTKLTDSTKEAVVLKYVDERDGVIFVEDHFMDYFNRDGKRAEFCGNGARTYVAFIHEITGETKITFESYAGRIEGFVDGLYNVKMPPVNYHGSREFQGIKGEFLTVGVPHFVIEGDTEKLEWETLIPIRWELNTNINVYKEIEPGKLRIRTFERGVEGETGACGTGATATAWCYARGRKLLQVTLQANGGELVVSFKEGNIYLGGGVERCSEVLQVQL